MRLGSILWNLLGLGLPLIIAALTVPQLITHIGAERFGFLALAWGMIGYAGALDLGIGRAATQRIASLIGAGEERSVPDVIATAGRITLLSGVAGMALILAGAALGIYRLIPVQSLPDSEIRASMALLAVALPMQAISATYRGVNEAYLNFAGVNVLRIALGAANFGAPFAVSLWTTELPWLVGTLVLSRAIALVFFRKLALACVAASLGELRGAYARTHAKALLKFGGWFTVSSILSPLLVQADRFFVGALVSAAAVTLYVLPYEVTVQALILVGAVTSVAFPVISGLLSSNSAQASAVFYRWLVRVVAAMLLLTSALAAVMPTLLYFWVGEHVSSESVRVGQILCGGVFLNAVGAMYFAMLHARGKTRATALLHMVEVPLFLGALYLGVMHWGIVGAACAWVARVGVDMGALMLINRRLDQEAK